MLPESNIHIHIRISGTRGTRHRFSRFDSPANYLLFPPQPLSPTYHRSNPDYVYWRARGHSLCFRPQVVRTPSEIRDQRSETDPESGELSKITPLSRFKCCSALGFDYNWPCYCLQALRAAHGAYLMLGEPLFGQRSAVGTAAALHDVVSGGSNLFDMCNWPKGTNVPKGISKDSWLCGAVS